MIGRWFVGFVVFVGYLCLGAFVFYRIERKEEEKRYFLEILEKLELKDLLAKHYSQVNSHVRRQFIQQLNAYCNKTILPEETDDEEHQYQWTYYNAFFFALTTLSTIGYGNLHPTSVTGRILVLVYSLIGIPLNGIVLTQLGSFFESRILRAHYSYKTQRMMGPQLSLIMDVVTYLIPGIIVFIFIPSYIISYFEEWTFDQSVYFAFVTLTTIGYGDYVAGQTVNTDMWYNVYKVFLVCWIMFGLGYLFMILSFISRAMRSKTLEHLFLERLKHTHSKIWHQFTKDVVYIRRILNESYLLKFKPVYKKEVSSSGLPLRRSQSSPNLTEWPVLRKTEPAPAPAEEDEDEEAVRRRFEKHRMKRRRALSQNRMRSLLRRTKATSEIDLAHIDKEATFGADIASYEILSRVVDALETAVPNQPPTVHLQQQPIVDTGNFNKKKAYSFSEGVQGFSAEQILASEKNEWTVGGDMLNRENTFAAKHRNSYFEYDTWAGADNRNFKKFNEYAKTGNCASGYQQQQQQQQQQQSKPRVPRLRRMSAAAFNFLSNNIAPKWLTDRLTDSGGSGCGGCERTDDPKHRLSLNDDHGYGYGSTYNGAANHNNLHVYNHSHTVQSSHNNYSRPSHNHQHGYNHNFTVQDHYGNRQDRGRRYDCNPAAAAYAQIQAASAAAAAAAQEPRNRRKSNPDPVLAHCANTIAVADFLMTLQRSLDNTSATMQPQSAMSRRQERRSPLYTLFQDRRDSRSSAESWQYSSMASTVSSSINVGGGGDDTTTTTITTASGRLQPPPFTTQPIPVPGTANTVVQNPTEDPSDVRQETKRAKKKRTRRFSIRPTASNQHAEPERGCRTATPTTAVGKDVRVDIED